MIKNFLFFFFILVLFSSGCYYNDYEYLNGDEFSFKENISKKIISKNFTIKNLNDDIYLKSFVTTCGCVRANFYYDNLTIENISSNVIFRDDILIKKDSDFTLEIFYNLTFHSKDYLGFRKQDLVVFDDKDNKIRIKILGDVYK